MNIRINRLHFYDYEACFIAYSSRIMKLRQHVMSKERFVAKPVFILSIIDGIDCGEFTNNMFHLNDWLEAHYDTLMQQYMCHSAFETTAINKPFWHLESDGFWHLYYLGEQKSKGQTPSKRWLKDNVRYAYFDDDLKGKFEGGARLGRSPSS